MSHNAFCQSPMGKKCRHSDKEKRRVAFHLDAIRLRRVRHGSDNGIFYRSRLLSAVSDTHGRRKESQRKNGDLPLINGNVREARQQAGRSNNDELKKI